MFLLFYFLVNIHSETKRYTIEAGDHGFDTIDNNVEEFIITIPAGECLMMVEWENSIISITIPDLEIKDLQFNNQMGYSLFTFKNDAVVTITIKSIFSCFHFPGPYLKTSGNATQFITNHNSDEFDIFYFVDFYMGTFGKYSLDVDVTTIDGDGKIIYNYNSQWYETNCKEKKRFDGIQYLTTLQSGNSVYYAGNVKINSKESYTPTIPTRVKISTKGVEQNEFKIEENMAYGGNLIDENGGGKSKKIIDISKIQYTTIINDVHEASQYTLYYINDDGKFDELHYMHKESDSQFDVDIFVVSSKCKTYTYVTRIHSTNLRIGSNGYLENETITNSMLPEICLEKKNAVSGAVIGCIILAILLVVAIIFIVILILKRRKKSDQSQETSLFKTI